MNQNLKPIHQPVLLNEVIDILAPDSTKKFIDATIGGGGHTSELLQANSQVLGIDQDASAIYYLQQKFDTETNLQLVQTNFISLLSKAKSLNFDPVDGILFDLGVSSLQLDTPSRGFSFLTSAPLDMRMNQSNSQTAADLLNTISEDELYELLVINSQESKARDIARAIINSRPLSTTQELADIVTAVYHGVRGHLHPATKTFQALRIAVNQELKVIKPAIKDAFSLLKIGGKLVVISFHEGEDRIIKRTFLEFTEAGQALQPKTQPMSPQATEIEVNPRARSAKLRFIERLK